MMNVMITGIGGFLGSHLAARFASRFEVIGISTSLREAAFPIYAFDGIGSISKNPDVIVHCHAAVSSGVATLDTQTLYKGNVEATQRIVNQFPHARHLYISSVSVYGNSAEILFENTVPNPQTEYAKSKFEAEQIIKQQQNSAIIRLSSLYGNGMKENTLIPNYANQALKKHEIEVWGTGERKQNYVHVNDTAALIEAVIEKGEWQQNLYLGTDSAEYSNNEIAQIIASETDASIVYRNSDASLSVQYNNAFTQKDLNWHPETKIGEAIKAYIQWKKRQS